MAGTGTRGPVQGVGVGVRTLFMIPYGQTYVTDNTSLATPLAGVKNA